MPVYAVMRLAKEAKKNPSGFNPVGEQRENSDLVVVAGSKARLGAMLDKIVSFELENFGSWHDGYNTVNSGRHVVLDFGSIGVLAINGVDNNGRSGGVAPEALASARGTQHAELEQRVSTALDAKREFEHNGTLYVPVAQSATIQPKP